MTICAANVNIRFEVPSDFNGNLEQYVNGLISDDRKVQDVRILGIYNCSKGEPVKDLDVCLIGMTKSNPSQSKPSRTVQSG